MVSNRMGQCWAGEGAHPTLGKGSSQVLAECYMTLACLSPKEFNFKIAIFILE